MNVDGNSLTKPLFEPQDHQIHMTIIDFEVVNSVPGEERAGYGSVKPKAELAK